MSHLLLGATVLLLILVGWISVDIMGLAFWKSNRFPVEGQVRIELAIESMKY